MRSRSFCLLRAWAALVALARFFSTKRSSWARRSAFAFALRASCSSGPSFLDVAAVVAGVAVYASVFQLQDRARDGVQEVAVVGDDEDGALGVLHEALEPLDGLEVEVVRRLVQQDQVWLL
jgi:hypothetical protein